MWPHRTSRLLAFRKGGCVAARDKPPSCVPQGRGLHPRRAAFLRAARAGAWPHRTSRLLACGKGGSSGIFAWWGPLSVRLAAGRSCPFLGLVCGGGLPRSPREGAVPPSIPSKGGSAPWTPEGGKCPPYPPLTGRVRDRTGQAALLPAARAGGLHPRQAAFLRAARAESLILQPGGTTRTRGNDTHARATASGPKREAKFFRPFEKRPQQGNNAGAEGIYPHQGPPP